MSELEKLSIIGIRSFSPAGEENQVVSFSTPLTLILGDNGTGKTTIIECLKYVITGSQPPNTKSGAFIHDPKLANTTEVKARVKLQFRDAKRRQCIVQRALALYQKRVKIEYKNLEGLISIQGEDGKSTSMSTRCGELDQEMSHLLGVSKSILSNVIFCHQEDSNWPLSEGKLLKTKFDDIFASSKFVKALDYLKKVKTAKSASIKELEVENRYLGENRQKKQLLMQEASVMSQKILDIKPESDSLKESITLLDQKLMKLNKDFEMLYNLRNDKASMELKCSYTNSYITDILSNINEKEMSETEEDLEQMISEYSEYQKEFKKGVEEKKQIHQELLSQKNKLIETKNNILSRESKIKMQNELLGTHKLDLKKLQDDLESEMEIKIDHDEECDKLSQLCEDIVEKIQSEINRIASGSKSKKEELILALNSKRTELDSLKNRKSRCEHLLTMFRDEMDKLNKKKESIVANSSNFDENQQKMHALEAEISSIENKLKEKSEIFNQNKRLEEISLVDKNICELEKKIFATEVEYSSLKEKVDKKTEFDELYRKKEAYSDEINDIKIKYSDQIQSFINGALVEPYTGNCRSELRNVNELVDRLILRNDELKSHLMTLEFDRDKLKEDLNIKRKILNEKEDFIRESGLVNKTESEFDSAIKAIESQISDIENQTSALKGSATLLKKYRKQVEEKDGSCPLCMRKFEKKKEHLNKLIKNLEYSIDSIPDQMNLKSIELERLRKELGLYIEYKPYLKEIDLLRDTHIPEISSKISKYSEEISQSISEQSESSKQILFLKSKVKFLQDFVTECNILDTNSECIRDIDAKISEINPDSIDESLSKMFMQTEASLSTSKFELEKTRNHQKMLHKEMNDSKSDINQLNEEYNIKMSSYLKFKDEIKDINPVESIKDIDDQIRDINEKSIRNSEDNEDLKRLIIGLEGEINETSSDIEKLQENYLQLINKLQVYGREATSIVDKIEDLNEIIAENSQGDLLRETLAIEEADSELKSQINSVEQDIQSLTSKISNSEGHYRYLIDNLNLRQKRKELKAYEEKLEELQERFVEFSGSNFEEERRCLVAKIEGLSEKKSLLDCSLHANQGKLDQINSELSRNTLKDANKKYIRAFFELKTNKKVVEDIDCAMKSLDQSILKYHSHKMDELNRLMKDLWRLTYMGTDIESIQIKVEDDSPENESMSTNPNKSVTSKNNRKVYSYRVTMTKRGIEMDMRSRCSAGQKVLAALIIRLALAEAFCTHCGILALDEPTTNLDKENISSLASSLIKLVNDRSENGTPFQLIIITHDEDFIKTLGDSGFADSILRVQRDHKGLSSISKITVDDLEMSQFE